MERITDISQLKKGDKIFSIADNGELTFIEFLCVHPHNPYYSLFLDIKQDGMPKFYNHNLQFYQWYRYDNNIKDEDILKMQIEILSNWIKNAKERYKI